MAGSPSEKFIGRSFYTGVELGAPGYLSKTPLIAPQEGKTFLVAAHVRINGVGPMAGQQTVLGNLDNYLLPPTKGFSLGLSTVASGYADVDNVVKIVAEAFGGGGQAIASVDVAATPGVVGRELFLHMWYLEDQTALTAGYNGRLITPVPMGGGLYQTPGELARLGSGCTAGTVSIASVGVYEVPEGTPSAADINAATAKMAAASMKLGKLSLYDPESDPAVDTEGAFLWGAVWNHFVEPGKPRARAPEVLLDEGADDVDFDLQLPQDQVVLVSVPGKTYAGAPLGLGGGGDCECTLTTPLELFVSRDTGNDANDGLTPGTAVETLAGAYSKITATALAADVVIHISGVEGQVWTPIPDYLNTSAAGQIILSGDGAGVGGDGFSEIATGTALAGTTAGSIVMAPVGSEDLYAAYTIEFTNGAAINQKRTVRNNTLTETIPTSEFFPAPAPGDTFRILAPAAEFLIDDVEHVCAGGNQSYPTIINLRFTGEGQLAVDNIACLKLYGVMLQGVTLQGAHAGVFAGLTFSVLNFENDIHFGEFLSVLPVASGWRGWGISSLSGGLVEVAPLAKFYGYAVATDITTILDACEMQLYGGRFTGLGCYRISNGSILCKADSVPTLFYSAILQGVTWLSDLGSIENRAYPSALYGFAALDSNVAFYGPFALEQPDGVAAIAAQSSIVHFAVDDGESVDLTVGTDVVAVLGVDGSKITIGNNLSGASVGDLNITGDAYTAFVIVSSELDVQLDNIAVGGTGFFFLQNFSSQVSILAGGVGTVTDCAQLGLGQFGRIVTELDFTDFTNNFFLNFCEAIFGGDFNTAIVGAGLTLGASDADIGGVLNTPGAALSVSADSRLTVTGAVDADSVLCIDSDILFGSLTVADTCTLVSSAFNCAQVTSTGGDAIVASAGSDVVTNNVDAAGTAVRLSTGSRFVTTGASAINAGVDGVNVSGGGIAAFETQPAIAATGNELVVAPGVTGTVLGDLNAAGVTFSNPGGGSTITLNNL